ncbi:oligomeric Golgi complex subunit 7 [Phascolomyces articulosus]|uniref:Conserved oligomeric Golgi complex subunit 7 n=1 Tax=Phascolomyces articulosus TaxID=60185 RepID=A0AAD5K3U5_9FUNG|nr:oligomeric Golgi complex subunit 7 [Phascolomyces articulosus]
MTSTAFDTTAFANPDFDIKSWINSTLKPRNHNRQQDDTSPKPNDEKSQSHQRPSEQEVTVLVTRLQLSSEQVSRKVGQVTDGVIKSLPRMLYDLKLITDDAQAAKRGIDQVRTHLSSSTDQEDNDNGNDTTQMALKKLQQLHIVKTHMEKCSAALKEAENWSNLEVEATRVLETQDYEGAASRLQNAQHSLDVFQHSPEFASRQELLRKLQSQLEQTVRPKVMDALQNHDAVECYKYFKIYGKMGKAEEFVDLYFEARNPKIIETWKNQQEDQAEWVESLDTFYKAMFASLSEDYVWCASIFPDPKPVVQAQIQHIFQSLDPSLADRLASIATHQGANALPILVSTFAVTESFGLSLERLFTKPPVNTASADNTTSLESLKKRARRQSNASQLTLIPLTLRHTDTNTWSYVLYVPFLPFQSQYASLEGLYLGEQLSFLFKRVESQKYIMATERVQYILTHVIDNIFSMAKESLERCLKMTHGFGAVEWLRTINAYIGQVKLQLQKTIRTIKLSSSATSAAVTLKKTQRQGSASSAIKTGTPRTSSDLDDLDFDDDDDKNDAEDWQAFQLELRLLRVCQTLDTQFNSFKDMVARELEGLRYVIQERDQDDNALLSPVTPSVLTFTERSPDARGHRRQSSLVSGGGIEVVSRHERKRSMGGSLGDISSTIGHQQQQLQQQQQAANYPRSSMALLRTSRLNSHELQRIISQLSTITEESQDSVINVVLKDANQHIDELTTECQALVHQAALEPIVRHLQGIASMKTVWQAPDPQPRKTTIEDATIDVDMPQFSLSPNEYITRVGEQLLMLPQEFEVYTDDPALAYHVETIPFIQQGDIHHRPSEEDEKGDEDGEEEDEEGEEDEIEVIELWSTCVARGTMKRFLDEIVKIRNLTSQGRRQLRTDIEYLINVLSALDVQPLPELNEFYDGLV